jgi:AcrR family transcriptional regulator
MDKRTQITQAALHLFIEHGFQNTSTANISKKAGVATGTLFLYFPTKDDLINSLYKEGKQRLVTALAAGFPKTGDAKTRLKYLWDTAFQWALTNNDAFRFMQMFKSSPLITKLTREELAPTGEFAVSFVRQEIKKGEIININIELLFIVVDSLLSAAVNYAAGKPVRSRKQIAEQAFDVLWNGIAAR